MTTRLRSGLKEIIDFYDGLDFDLACKQAEKVTIEEYYNVNDG